MKNEELISLAMEIHILGVMVSKTTMQAMEGRGILAEAGVSMLQFGVLQALRRRAFTIGELSDIMLVDPSTLVSVVDALERKGLAARGRDPSDRRRVPITLTRRGMEISACHPSKKPFAGAENPLLKSIEAMGPERAQALLDLQREMVGHLPDGGKLLERVSTWVHVHTAPGGSPKENE